MVVGKIKGGEYEREVAKKLSLWVTNGKRDDVLWRSALSGGRATVRYAKGKKSEHIAGDICAVHADGFLYADNVYTECKHYKDLDITQFILKDTGKLADFWREAQEKASQYKRAPILIARQNRMPDFVLARFPFAGCYLAHIRTPKNCYMILLETFLKIPPKEILGENDSSNHK